MESHAGTFRNRGGGQHTGTASVWRTRRPTHGPSPIASMAVNALPPHRARPTSPRHSHTGNSLSCSPHSTTDRPRPSCVRWSIRAECPPPFLLPLYSCLFSTISFFSSCRRLHCGCAPRTSTHPVNPDRGLRARGDQRMPVWILTSKRQNTNFGQSSQPSTLDPHADPPA